MLKITALLFNTFALLIYQLFFADVVTITPNIPSTAKAETEFTVELTVNKGSSGGFAKLQQELPAGFTAIEDKNNGASFTFSNQSVKFIWMSLPADKEFKVSYKVAIAAGTTGAKIIAGKFSYVSDNVKQTVEIAPTTITITGSEGAQPIIATTPKAEVTPTPVATTPPAAQAKPVTPPSTTATTASASASTGDQSTIDCFRTTTANAKSPSEFPVEVTIKKGNLSGFAKFIETLPVGLTATVIEAKGAAFSFVDQKVKFVWGTLPAEAEFKISYKINVAPNITGDQIIEGIFSFIENDQTKKFVLPQTSVKTGPTEVSQPIATTPKATETPAKPTPTPSVAVAEKATPKEKPKQESVVAKAEPKVPKEMSANKIATPQGKVSYKVQILALRKNKSIDIVASLLTVTEPIEPEQHQGLNKYVVGYHAVYKEARDHREQIPKAVIAPWVVAYSQGSRTTVQDALMITTQQWYR